MHDKKQRIANPDKRQALHATLKSFVKQYFANWPHLRIKDCLSFWYKCAFLLTNLGSEKHVDFEFAIRNLW
ncbi:hypothetical protein CXU22_02040 [Akkermansia muciniphila]|uniref:Uncharacterized protein n=1 Tax=Akkermansia muciniphila TaxID=239935 RepID=A0A2N8HGC6_9BACT|nr:hypothetical protein CXU22_02040 [Akkermansia muciniphila]